MVIIFVYAMYNTYNKEKYCVIYTSVCKYNPLYIYIYIYIYYKIIMNWKNKFLFLVYLLVSLSS